MKKKNTISLETAKKWTKNWRDKESTYNKYHECKAFNIPKIDLQEVLAEKGVEGVRAYLGVDEKGVEKLMFVGVDAKGKDMIRFAKNSALKGDFEDEDIYDFTDPCPSTCDENSPLNG